MPDDQIRAWFLARRLLIAVGVVVGYHLVSWGVEGLNRETCVILAASSAGLFALGSINHPGFVFGLCVVLWISLPTVFDSSNHQIFDGSCAMGWFAGAIAGWISRSLRRRRDPEIVYLDPPPEP